MTETFEDVLESVARALERDEARRTHLFDLVRAANTWTSATRRRAIPERVRPNTQRVLDFMSAPAIVRNGQLDLLGANTLGRAVLTRLRRPNWSTECGSIHFSESARQRLLPRLGELRERCCRNTGSRSWP